ncbi:hypothetical protein DPMN_101031 [Dreissena polymorpha]|uniref:Uncharacterized protein n=1 Tax=Dreissena polymorpha TaxID=45954 RepID=A0A9D4R985_DREPO|nr:hypothetical protein DPMN_101031 [Dreissena polymorpha]
MLAKENISLADVEDGTLDALSSSVFSTTDVSTCPCDPSGEKIREHNVPGPHSSRIYRLYDKCHYHTAQLCFIGH